MLFGSEGERALWEAVDLIVFGGKEPKTQFLEATRNFEPRANCGQLLKSLRRRAQKTPTEAAREAGVAPGRWRHWEANTALLSQDELSRVCSVLAVTESDRRELLREHRRAPAVYFERIFRGWERSSKRVARSADEHASGQATGENVLEQLEPAVLSGLSSLLFSRFGKAATREELVQALDHARALTPENRRAWIAEVVEFLEDECR